MNTVKELNGIQYYTGAHSEIRRLCSASRRPTEYGNKVWATSLLAIEHLHQHKSSLQGLRVLEVGCGWGLLGIYLAKKFACHVTCSDIDPQVLPIVQVQAELNRVDVQLLQAGFSDLSEEVLKHFDLIVGAEICYSEEVACDIVEMLKRASQAGVQSLIIADPGRPDFDSVLENCTNSYQTDVYTLPGSINGKRTQLLSVALQESVCSQ